MIKEDFLHYLWKLKKIDLNKLVTTNGELVTILDFGTYNTDSGPDFFNAKVKIDETIWVGNIEMHVFSSDWMKHNHNKDKAYNNVILHVVYQKDLNASTYSGIELPTIELKSRINKNDLKKYKLLRFNTHWIPCEKLIGKTSQISKTTAIEKALTDRLINKSNKLKQLLDLNQQNWNEAFYILILRYFGMKVNSEAFEMLGKSTPYNIILKERDDRFKIEAILYGQAGFLDREFKDEYPNQLKKEYLHLKTKYNLQTIPVSVWKFLRLRPSNFPTVRISQLAEILTRKTQLFSIILEEISLDNIKALFKAKTSDYWSDHYLFDEKSVKKTKSFGATALKVLIINTIVPTLFLYGHINSLDVYKEKSIDLLLEIKAEKNSKINNWANLGFNIKTAYDSQALLELKLNYCDNHKCLQCPIGNDIMNKN